MRNLTWSPSEQSNPIKIMFVCHGNICRSPMAEFIMKDLVCKAGLKEHFKIASCATSNEEIGNDIYSPAKRCLDVHGIPYTNRHATRLKAKDYDEWDLFVCMDAQNVRNIERIFFDDPPGKVHRLGEYAVNGSASDVADPWYTGDFERTYEDVADGCTGLMHSLISHL